jgi:CRISPR-associated endonuclease Csy4
MCDHYIDVRLRSSPELMPHQILSGLYGRLHHGLVQLDSKEIGVSFPEYDEHKPSLGSHLRLHGSETALRELMATDWLQGMQDYLRLDTIATTPTGTKHRVVSRVQANSNVERLRRRAMSRHGISQTEATQRLPDSATERLHLPFVILGSRSTRQSRFPLFIRQGALLEQPVAGTFSSYGLSQRATVPWF